MHPSLWRAARSVLTQALHERVSPLTLLRTGKRCKAGVKVWRKRHPQRLGTEARAAAFKSATSRPSQGKGRTGYVGVYFCACIGALPEPLCQSRSASSVRLKTVRLKTVFMHWTREDLTSGALNRKSGGDAAGGH